MAFCSIFNLFWAHLMVARPYRGLLKHFLPILAERKPFPGQIEVFFRGFLSYNIFGPFRVVEGLSAVLGLLECWKGLLGAIFGLFLAKMKTFWRIIGPFLVQSGL